jgi:CHAT domain-containing protein/tetratricopeptide (TPR) repeat protein
VVERPTHLLEHVLPSCAVLQIFDLAALTAILDIDDTAASMVLACDVVEAVEATQPLYRLKPDIAQMWLERLRTTRALDELPLHSRAFRYYLGLLGDRSSAPPALYEGACMHHLRALRNLLLEYVRRAEAADIVATFRAVAAQIQPQHTAQLALFDAYDAMRLHAYDRSAAIIEVLLQQPALDPSLRAEAWIFRGLGSLNQSHLEQARADFETAFAIAEAANDRVMSGLALINQATIYHQLNQFDRALAVCQHSLAKFQQAADTYNAAFALYCIGNNALYLGQWESGLLHLDQAATIYQRAGMAARLAMVDWARGFLNQILGDNAASEHAYLRALEISTSAEYHDDVLAVDALMHLGLLYHTQGQLPRAEQAYADAIELAVALGDRHRQALLLHHHGRALAEQGDRAGARRILATAVECLEQLRISTRSEEIKIDLLGTVQQVYESTVLEYLACGDHTAAFTYVERARARAFLDLVAQRGEIDHQAIAPTSTTLQELQALLAPDALVLEYFTIGVTPAANAFLSDLAAHNPQLSQQLLSAPSVVLFAITAQSFEVHQLLIDPNLLVPIADGQTMPRVPLTERKLTWLYQNLVMPVAHMFADKRVVHIIPHGPLHALPFAALRQSSGMPLLQSGGPAIVYAPSATVLATCLAQSPARDGRTLVLGYDDQGAAALSFAEPEARVVGELTDGHAVIGPAPKSPALFAAGPQLRHLHIAGHAIFIAADPMSSYLRLGSDDNVDARALMEHLQLRGTVVVLNACMSGVSRIVSDDEFLGLPRALLYAGASTIVCTQYAVDDIAAAILMVFFYRNLAAGLGPAEALHQAQLTLRQQERGDIERVLQHVYLPQERSKLPSLDTYEQRPFSHQRYWSPFIVIGKP